MKKEEKKLQLNKFTIFAPFIVIRIKIMKKPKEITYTSDGKCSVFCGKTEIARSYVSEDGYEVRILQGMDRMKTWDKIFEDCPEFAKNNDMDINKVPKLFPYFKSRKKI